MRVLVVIPAFNEVSVIATTIKDVITQLKRYPHAEVLVVDDGSSDGTAAVAKNTGVHVVSHILNRGLGGALGTGLAYARHHGFDVVVTMDADGQHDSGDLHSVLAPILSHQADIVIGSRFLSSIKAMPRSRQILNRLSNLFTYLLFGFSSSDSQSGFRGFGPKAVAQLQLRTERMEVSSEIFSEVKRLHLTLTEVPISVIYTSYSLSKGQQGINAVDVVYKLILRLFR